MTTITDEPNKELVHLGAAIEKIKSGDSVTMKDLLKVLRPETVNPPMPVKVPPTATITDDQRKALERLVEVFGQVVPTERRALEPAEITLLMAERNAIAAIKKMSETRNEGIRTTVFNHLDVVAERVEDVNPIDTPRDGNGFYILKGEAVGSEGAGEKFTREVREGSPSLDLARLKELSEDEEFEGFDHADYLALTTQTRVVDEVKIMLALRKNPSLVAVIAKASKPGSKTSSFNVRKS